jgi:stage III sporulation protein SpoIIIAA
MKSIKPVVGLVLVFILGAGSGSVATYLFSQAHLETARCAPPHSREEMLLRRLAERLSLDSEQQQQVKTTIHDTHQRIQLVRQRTRPEIETLVTEGQQRIRTFLRPDQKRIFEEIVAERRERGHGHGRGGRE